MFSHQKSAPSHRPGVGAEASRRLREEADGRHGPRGALDGRSGPTCLGDTGSWGGSSGYLSGISLIFVGGYYNILHRHQSCLPVYAFFLTYEVNIYSMLIDFESDNQCCCAGLIKNNKDTIFHSWQRTSSGHCSTR